MAMVYHITILKSIFQQNAHGHLSMHIEMANIGMNTKHNHLVLYLAVFIMQCSLCDAFFVH
jgi:hypothetical protein